MSAAPLRADAYVDGDLWANDVAAVIDQLKLEKPVLVGWSYGGYVVCDYLRKFGQQGIAGINLVAAAVVLGPDAFGTLIGPGFLENAPGAADADVPTNIAAVRNFLHACLVKPVALADLETILAFNMLVPPAVRGFLIQRQLDFSDVLEGIHIPLLVTHGRADHVVLPAMSEYILERCSTASASWYDGVGHAPFIEEPGRFNRELAAFVNG
jgi:pimeloyl-ACP methyl ester carboxylesterase